MDTKRNSSALTIHGVGWAALLATVLVVRTGIAADGWATWWVITAGVVTFAGCAAWSVSAILDRIQAIEATTQSRVIRPTPPDSTRFSKLSTRDSSPWAGTTVARRLAAHS